MGLFTFAKQLGRNDCASVLQQTLEEEKAADKLTTIADSRVRPRSGRDCRSCTRGFRRRTRRGLH
jgi:ferritin-like metal-binding protein YciE